MEVTVHIPDEAAADLPDNNGEMPRKLLEAYALEGYKSGELTAHQIKELLGSILVLRWTGFSRLTASPSNLRSKTWRGSGLRSMHFLTNDYRLRHLAAQLSCPDM